MDGSVLGLAHAPSKQCLTRDQTFASRKAIRFISKLGVWSTFPSPLSCGAPLLLEAPINPPSFSPDIEKKPKDLVSPRLCQVAMPARKMRPTSWIWPIANLSSSSDLSSNGEGGVANCSGGGFGPWGSLDMTRQTFVALESFLEESHPFAPPSKDFGG